MAGAARFTGLVSLVNAWRPGARPRRAHGAPRRSVVAFLGGCARILICIAAVVAVFFATPVINRIYDGWPRGWLVLSIATLSALSAGIPAGLAALATGVVLIWARGTMFRPMHPGIEIFAALGLVQISVIQRLHQRTKALRRSEALFAEAFHGNAAGMAMVRPDGLMLDANDALARLFGCERDDLVGHSAASVWLRAEDREILLGQLQEQRGVVNREARLVKKNGEEWTALISAQMTAVDDQPVIVSSVVDISDRKRAEEALREAARVKDEFLAVLSHELRTPLNVILGYSRMLREGAAAADVVTTSQIIERNAVAQMRLVEDLLDVQRIANGGLKVEYSTFDLRALTHSVLESLHPMIAAKGLHCAGLVQEVRIDADRARIQQVLWNLLSNAIKFTPAGGCIGVSAVEQGDEVIITVEDSGEGIPPGFLAHLFEPFRQLDMSSTRRHGGLGLGLAIARNIVAAHGGTIAAESEGSGARFVVRLPIGRLASARLGSEHVA